MDQLQGSDTNIQHGRKPRIVVPAQHFMKTQFPDFSLDVPGSLYQSLSSF